MSKFGDREGGSALLTVYPAGHWLEAMEAGSDFQSSATMIARNLNKMTIDIGFNWHSGRMVAH